MAEYPQYVNENNSMGYLSDDRGASYNLCHCVYASASTVARLLFKFPRPLILFFLVWSNFEIANMDFWRGEAYSKFFDYLDATGGFYYEVGDSLHMLITFFAHFCMMNIASHTNHTRLQCSAGETHRCTVLPLGCLRARIRFTSSRTWATRITHCPAGTSMWSENKCSCDRRHNFGMLTSSIYGLLMLNDDRLSWLLVYVPME